MNVQADHVSDTVGTAKKHAVSATVMGFLKGKLALRMFDQFPELRRRYWGQHVWSRGYCVGTVGE
ncbi:MAG: transposase [Ardenticatenales bacterium]|nr:transposase [Ardenticatenales bacterium]